MADSSVVTINDTTPTDSNGNGAMAVKVFVAMLASQKVSALLQKVGVSVDPNVAGAALGTGLHMLHSYFTTKIHLKKTTVPATITTTSNPS